MAEAGAGDQPEELPILFAACRHSPVADATLVWISRAVFRIGELTHFKKFTFSAPTRSGFPRILKNETLLSVGCDRADDAPIFARVAILRLAGEIDDVDIAARQLCSF